MQKELHNMRDIWNYPTVSEYWLKRSGHGDAAKSIIYLILEQITRTQEGDTLTIESKGFEPEAYELALLRLKELGWNVQILFHDLSYKTATVTVDLSPACYFRRDKIQPMISV
jgi:hypothetical protein